MTTASDPEELASAKAGMKTNGSLESLQTDEQRRILDTVSKVRKCGLDRVLSLPQIVVCGDQSAGKSSLLEALTEIPFPRNDNLCTRFATEISLRREPDNSITIRIIPDSTRSLAQQNAMRKFTETITNFKDLPDIMGKAMDAMGISSTDNTGSAFARDTLSIDILGPDQPHLTLVDIPGLIQASTKGVSEADVAMVAEITDSYIKQPRTICLAVVSATNDAANQPILQRVRKFDPQGERTLGVITKPDRLSAGSGSEAKFLELARNEDVFFKLGWHVIKNRKFEESEYSVEERNLSERTFFSTSGFKSLPKGDVGIDALRTKLSHLLIDHSKKELPRLREDLDLSLSTAYEELKILGEPRTTALECRVFLARLNLECYEICKAGISGNYEHDYFKAGIKAEFSLESKTTIARIRAAVQYANTAFAEAFRKKSHKYQILFTDDEEDFDSQKQWPVGKPKILTKKEALEWVRITLLHSRGTELIGNFNPNVIAELFWEQSEDWDRLAKSHIEKVHKLCESFLSDLLDQTLPIDLKARIWSLLIHDRMKARRQAALHELNNLSRDRKEFPINYNHYYTATICKNRRDRIKDQIGKHLKSDHASTRNCSIGSHYPYINMKGELASAIDRWGAETDTSNMDEFSCEEALDGLLAIYKVQQKTFIANVTTQIIERHVVRNLHDMFSPLVVVSLPDAKIENVVSEPRATKTQRAFLTERIKNLEDGQDIFRGML